MNRLLAVSVAGALAVGVSAPAHAAAKPAPFKVVKKTGLRGEDRFTAVIAPGRRSAFAFGHRGLRDRLESLAYRWNGTSWTRTPLPKGVTGSFGTVSAGSASDVWATVPRNSALAEKYLGPNPPECPTERRRPAQRRIPAPPGVSKVLHWNGKRWAVARTFKNAYVSAITSVSRKNVWAFGVDTKGAAAWHYNGRTWKRQAAPALVEKAGSVKGGKIWTLALPPTLPESRAGMVATFDGRRWTRQKPLRTEPAPTDTTVGYAAIILDVTVVGRRQVWLSALKSKSTRCGEGDLSLPYLRWTGRTWVDETGPAISDWLPLGGPVADGAGGVFMLCWGADTDEEFDFDIALFHRVGKARWTRQVLSDQTALEAIAHVPGTRSLLGVGYSESRYDTDATIWLKPRP